ncbi:hypothetical protein H0H81_006731, partial [Sphagnurus paluster]
ALSASLAIGLSDSTIVLYRHLDQSLASSTALTAVPEPRIVHESLEELITGLGFREPTEENPSLFLFIMTISRVLSYHVYGKDSSSTPTVVDEIGCGHGCAMMGRCASNMVTAKDKGIFFCGTEGRGPCYAYEWTKSSIQSHLNYLVIVLPPFFASAASASATVRNFATRMPNYGESDIAKVIVFEPGNKFILTSNRNLLCLQEKSTATKLDLLYHKSLYSLALSLAKTQQLDKASVADIHRQYGEYLYVKGECDTAMQQFVQTIGHLQPSCAIRKFLDAQGIHHLVTYFQELHSLGLANSDHITLLLVGNLEVNAN